LKQPVARGARGLRSKLRGSRGNEAQTEENMEPPYVGCHRFEPGRNCGSDWLWRRQFGNLPCNRAQPWCPQ
jgi:hypothetical protein